MKTGEEPLMKDADEDLGLEIAVQDERINTLHAQYLTGVSGIHADMAKCADDNTARETRIMRTIYAVTFRAIGLDMLIPSFVIRLSLSIGAFFGSFSYSA